MAMPHVPSAMVSMSLTVSYIPDCLLDSKALPYVRLSSGMSCAVGDGRALRDCLGRSSNNNTTLCKPCVGVKLGSAPRHTFGHPVNTQVAKIGIGGCADSVWL
mmetsp:Transcript_30039/g.43926  ORF Transcript_30039/g.43926 Transcript_30039/m.43926 type:complete len:103 (-) Transcript_30039:62-370(-)